jgi:hypothetical protein
MDFLKGGLFEKAEFDLVRNYKFINFSSKCLLKCWMFKEVQGKIGI